MDPRLREIIVCPQCRGDLVDSADTGLICPACELRYPIVDGIPVLLVDDAAPTGASGPAPGP
ncbi:MAG: Trm112 family protein [Nocardioides sp.]